MDKNLTNLLRWSVEHTTTSTAAPGVDGGDAPSSLATTSTAPDSASSVAVRAIEAAPDGTSPSPSAAQAGDSAPESSTSGAGARPGTQLDPAMLQALLGGPSDADLMRAAMETVNDPDPSIPLATRLVALDNFEQLIESIDNANNLAALSLWTPLLACLAHPEPEIRRMAAWCVGTAVQNNERSQDRLLAVGGIPPLVGLAADAAQPPDVRKKALYALSSACRNYQPALNACVEEMAKMGVKSDGDALAKVDAADMESVDGVIQLLREHAAAAA